MQNRRHMTGLPTLGVIALQTLYIVIFIINSCRLCNLKTVWGIFMKIYKNIMHHKTWTATKWFLSYICVCPVTWKPLEMVSWNVTQIYSIYTIIKYHRTMCRIQEPIIMVYLLLQFQPFEHCKYWFLLYTHVHSSTWKPFEMLLCKFTQMLSTMRQHAVHKNHNACLPTFGVMAFWTLLNTLYPFL